MLERLVRIFHLRKIFRLNFCQAWSGSPDLTDPYFLLEFEDSYLSYYGQKRDFEILPPISQIPLEDWAYLFHQLDPSLQVEVKKYLQGVE